MYFCYFLHFSLFHKNRIYNLSFRYTIVQSLMMAIFYGRALISVHLWTVKVIHCLSSPVILLLSLITATYGGDGRTTFALPDLRGRMAVGQGQGSGLTYRQLGLGSGASDVTLTAETMPAHNHLVRTSSASSGNVEEPSSTIALGILESSEGTAFGYLKGSASGTIERDLNEKTVQDTGNGYSHNNMMPCMAINYIICYRGIYPQRS